MKVYVSGPISLNGTASADEQMAYVAAFEREASRLRAEGHEVFSPPELPRQESWKDYMRLCIPAVCACDELVVLPDWPKSRGSVFELLVATTCGIRVRVAAGGDEALQHVEMAS